MRNGMTKAYAVFKHTSDDDGWEWFATVQHVFNREECAQGYIDKRNPRHALIYYTIKEVFLHD
jgi:hypothetical protein